MGMISLFSCVKVLDYEIPEDEKRIVINGLLSDSDTFKVYIHKSLHILDRLGTKAINNALVELYDGDQIVSAMNQGTNGFYTSNYMPAYGHDYRLTVSVPGMKTASARCILPVPVPIERVDTTMTIHEDVQYHSIYYNDSSIVTEVKTRLAEIFSIIAFTDPGETENYYELEGTFSNFNDYAYSLGDSSAGPVIYPYYYMPYMKSNDPLIELCYGDYGFISRDERDDYYSGQKMLLSDQFINGQHYALKVSFNSFDLRNVTDSTTVAIRLKSVTKDYFVYMQMLEKHLQVKDDPLSEPSPAYTNIQDGLGILGGMSESVFVLNFKHLMIR